MKRILYIVLMLSLPGLLSAPEDCRIRVEICVTDALDRDALGYAVVWSEELNNGRQTDESGCTELQLCKGENHLRITHLGCHPQRLVFNISADTSIVIPLEHQHELLQQVTITTDRRNESTGLAESSIGAREISERGGSNLGEMLSSIGGVQLLKTGPGIVQPMIHGLYGNRLAIARDGMLLGSQRWGGEHAPEMDPFFANRLQVVKGSESVRYGPDAIGGLLMVNSAPLPEDEHLHGSVHYGFRSNNLQHYLAARLEGGFGHSEIFRWRVQTSTQIAGDAHAPGYRLSNTGQRLWNLEGELGIRLERAKIRIGYTEYLGRIGILRAAHIGNTTDLQNAIESGEPQYTGPFSYRIGAPRQWVNHYGLFSEIKLDGRQPGHQWEFSYHWQSNKRREYDIRRGGRSARPSIDMKLHTHQIRAEKRIHWNGHDHHRTDWGVDLQFQVNNNIPGTGVNPVIPNHTALRPALYLSHRWKEGRWTVEGGLRYGMDMLWVKRLDSDRQLQEPSHEFHAVAGEVGSSLKATEWLDIRAQLGLSVRPPRVNELYSQGLHHGTATIEEGNDRLLPENGWMLSTSLLLNPTKGLYIELSPYLRFYRRFIYLEPQAEPRLTIRGAFPVQLYRQTDTRIAGIDMSARYRFWKELQYEVRISYLRATDLENNQPLVLMPADRYFQRLSYSIAPKGKAGEITFAVEGIYTARQTRFVPELDVAVPPGPYFLMNAEVGVGIPMGKFDSRIGLRAMNLLNRSYRDYLNRWRHFADETGIDIQINWQFNF